MKHLMPVAFTFVLWVPFSAATEELSVRDQCILDRHIKTSFEDDDQMQDLLATLHPDERVDLIARVREIVQGTRMIELRRMYDMGVRAGYPDVCKDG